MTTLSQLLKKIYPQEHKKILSTVQKLGKCKHKLADEGWYQDIILYVTYPDAFCHNDTCDLTQLNQQVESIKKLGCNAIHVLPFYKSPMIDLGFDVSDYLTVRENLGGNKAFNSFIKTCRDNDIKVLIDIVLNHVSFKHEWFQKAIKGQTKYRDFFIYRKKKPKFIKLFQKDGKTWARYDIKGEQKDVFLIFPDQAGEIPHWYQAEDGYWYYHTFYPHQLDVNWNNPQVFVEFAKILNYWAKKGVSFRLDAIPFIGKDINQGTFTDDVRTEKIVQALHQVVVSTSPSSIFLSEVAFELEKIKNYFGSNDIIESELSYNFPLNAKLWLSILQEDTRHIWPVIQQAEKNIPLWAGWVNFLRNHDALMVDRIKKKEKDFVLSTLKERGELFASNTNVSGRTYSFLKNKAQHLALVYMLLSSLPGCPAIIYGDEFAKCNDYEYMDEMVEWKKTFLDDDEVQQDTRDICRGHVHQCDQKSHTAISTFESIAKIFKARKKHSTIFQETPQKMKVENPAVFAAKYNGLKVLINLGSHKTTVKLDKKMKVMLQIGTAKIKSKTVVLAAHSGVWMK